MTSHLYASEFQDKVFSFFTREIYINIIVEYSNIIHFSSGDHLEGNY